MDGSNPDSKGHRDVIEKVLPTESDSYEQRKTLIGAGIAIWGVLVAAAIVALTAYSMTPGDVQVPVKAGVAGIPVSSSDFTLVMAVHPRCPCTRASVEELARLLARWHHRVNTRVLMFLPGDPQCEKYVESEWAQTDLWKSVVRLPGAALQLDPDGKLAAQIGCRTSGSVVLYDRDGEVRFWGGITAGRGHSGGNPGSDLIHGIVSGELSAAESAPVFGCSLQSLRLSYNSADGKESIQQ
ncbi:hypothetical protein GC176_15495 [bacterium]|nr:hypothetical protein [bacterium]